MSIETMTKLATVTVGSGGSAAIEFTNIPQTYTDLVLRLSLRGNRAASENQRIDIQFNNSTSNYSERWIRLLDGAVGSGSETNNIQFGAPGAANTANTFSNDEIYIPNYAGSNNKSISIDNVSENNGTNVFSYLAAGLWSDSAAITSIKLIAGNAGTSLVQHSTATLYGVRNARRATGNSIKATGGNISFDGTYVVHTFTSSGTFTPTVGLLADYLVVAGGGGGGGDLSGGGGAGGLRSTVTATGGGGSLESALYLTGNTNYTVTVGAGGAGNTASGAGTNGSNSEFFTITSTGGGGGAGDGTAASVGGSGGGGSSQRDSANGTTNQGFAGGNRGGSAGSGSGGGGGAGAVGGNGSSSAGNGGNGGAGVATLISGSSATYAGGGGGGGDSRVGGSTAGSGGSGGGGAGGRGTAGSAGTANTGGGGGGGGQSGGDGGAGGSGIVIIRYKA